MPQALKWEVIHYSHSYNDAIGRLKYFRARLTGELRLMVDIDDIQKQEIKDLIAESIQRKISLGKSKSDA